MLDRRPPTIRILATLLVTVMGTVALTGASLVPQRTQESHQEVHIELTGTVVNHYHVFAHERLTSNGHYVESGIVWPRFDSSGTFSRSATVPVDAGQNYEYAVSLSRYWWGPVPFAQHLACEVSTEEGQVLARTIRVYADSVTCVFRAPGGN